MDELERLVMLLEEREHVMAARLAAIEKRADEQRTRSVQILASLGVSILLLILNIILERI